MIEKMNVPLSGQTFKFFQTMDQRSIGFNYYAKRKPWWWREDFSKRRMDLEGESILENEEREAGGLADEAGAFQWHFCVVLCA